jgi:hypothetical protein
MTSYTTRSSYPYPDPSDQVADYPTTASSFAGYLDHLPNRNAIINPVMDIWQRGTSFSNPATGSYTADRWRIDYDGAGGTRTVARNTISLGTNLPSGIQGKYFMEVTLTNAGTATTQSISQRVERVNTFAGETITLSAWVRNDGAGTGVNTLTARAIQNFGTGGSPSTAVSTTLGTASVTGSWVRLHVHATLPSISGKTIGSNGDDYLEIKFDLGNQTGRFWLYGVQLEQNTTQTALERRPVQQELALCQRYYQRFTATTAYARFAVGQSYSGSGHFWLLHFPTSMRIAPSSIDTSGLTASNFAITTNSGGTQALNTLPALAATANSPHSAYLEGTTSGGGTTGAANMLIANNLATAFLGFSSEL